MSLAPHRLRPGVRCGGGRGGHSRVPCAVEAQPPSKGLDPGRAKATLPERDAAVRHGQRTARTAPLLDRLELDGRGEGSGSAARPFCVGDPVQAREGALDRGAGPRQSLRRPDDGPARGRDREVPRAVSPRPGEIQPGDAAATRSSGARPHHRSAPGGSRRGSSQSASRCGPDGRGPGARGRAAAGGTRICQAPCRLQPEVRPRLERAGAGTW